MYFYTSFGLDTGNDPEGHLGLCLQGGRMVMLTHTYQFISLHDCLLILIATMMLRKSTPSNNTSYNCQNFFHSHTSHTSIRHRNSPWLFVVLLWNIKEDKTSSFYFLVIVSLREKRMWKKSLSIGRKKWLW